MEHFWADYKTQARPGLSVGPSLIQGLGSLKALVLVLLLAFSFSSCTNDSPKTKVTGVNGAKPNGSTPSGKVNPRKKKGLPNKTGENRDENEEDEVEKKSPTDRVVVAETANVENPKLSKSGTDQAGQSEIDESGPASPIEHLESPSTSVRRKTQPQERQVVAAGADTAGVQAADEKPEPVKLRYEVLKLQQLIAVLKDGHHVFSEATGLHFKVNNREALSMSVLKEVSMFLNGHIKDQKFVKEHGNCEDRERRRKSKVEFRREGAEVVAELSLASCSTTEWNLAMSVWFGQRPDFLKLELVHANLGSTHSAGIEFISAKAKCSFYYNPKDLGVGTLRQMDCGQSNGSCGQSQSNHLVKYEGLAMSIPSSRAGAVEVALFERFVHRASETGAKSDTKFYACGHRFEQKRTQCAMDCLERKNTVVGKVMSDGKLHIDHDYRSAEQEAHTRRQQALQMEKTQAANEAIKKQNEIAQKAAAAQKAAQAGQLPGVPAFQTATPEELAAMTLEQNKEYEQNYEIYKRALAAYNQERANGAAGVVPPPGTIARPTVDGEGQAQTEEVSPEDRALVPFERPAE